MKAPPFTDAEFAFLKDFVGRNSAIHLDAKAMEVIAIHLGPVIREAGSVPQLIRNLRAEADPGLCRRVIESLAVHETTFFRDVRPFSLLRSRVLPDLISRRTTARALVIWCGACSSGQEPYSIAMLIRESFPHLLGWDLRILATDLSERVLARAREGAYTQLEVNRGLPAPYLLKFFRREGTVWRLAPEVRRMVEFRPLNLMAAWPHRRPIDIVFMRNVMIYFDIETRKCLLERLDRAMAPDGYLFLGEAETALTLHASFQKTGDERVSCFQRNSREGGKA